MTSPVRTAMEDRTEVEVTLNPEIREQAHDQATSQGQAISNLTRVFYINGALRLASGSFPPAALPSIQRNTKGKVTKLGPKRKTYRFYMPRATHKEISAIYTKHKVTPSLVVEASMEYYADTGLVTALIERPES